MTSELLEALSPTPSDVPGVITTLGAVKEAAATVVPRGPKDGIAAFTTLYERITCGVQKAVESGLFEAGDFIKDLDVAFACRYLSALHALESGGTVPRCWRVLFDVRSKESVPTLNYAMAGVNAHVNFDLTFALLTTWDQHSSPAERDAQHRDYCRINDIFYANMDALRAEFESPLSEYPDGSVPDWAGNMIGDFLVRTTRDFAWHQAMKMWPRRDDDGWTDYYDTEEARQDHIAAWVGHGIIEAKFVPA
jgi:hypothetical protein